MLKVGYNNLDALFQAYASFLDDVREIFKPLEYSVENVVTDVVHDLQETIDCTIMAVENVFSLGGMFAINPEYERRCKSVTKDLAVTPTAQDTYFTQQTETSNAHRLLTSKEMPRGNENTTNEISKHIKESLADASPRIQLIIEKNDAQKRIQNANSFIKNETDRLVVISRMIRQELDNLSTETKTKFNIHDIDLEHVSVHQILGEIGALYKLEQSDKSSSQANEIRHLFDKILDILRVNTTGRRVYSDDDEVKEILKNLEKTENDTLTNIEEKLSVWTEGDLKKTIVHNENINKLQKEIDNIPKTFQDIAKKIFDQESTNNMDVRKNFQNTAYQIISESNAINMNQILKSTEQDRNIFNKSRTEQAFVSNIIQARVNDIVEESEKELQNMGGIKSSQNTATQVTEESRTVDITKEQEQTFVSNGIQESVGDAFENSKVQKENVDLANTLQSIANEVIEESKPVDTDQILKSTKEATNIFSQLNDQQQQEHYISNIVQSSVDDLFNDSEKEYQIVDITKNSQNSASQVMEESKSVDTTKEQEQAFVSNGMQESFNNIFVDSRKQKENVDIANSFQTITNLMEESKSVDNDQIVKSADEDRNLFSPSTNEQQKPYVSNIVRAHVEDIFKDLQKQYQDDDIIDNSQNTASRIMEESKTVYATKEQEQVSNSVQESFNSIFDNSTNQKENVDPANSIQSITNQVTKDSELVDTDQILKATEEATNILNSSTNEQQEYYVLNSVRARVHDIFKDSEVDYQNVDVIDNSQITASGVIEESKAWDMTKEPYQSFISNNFQESVDTFEDSKIQNENVDHANSFHLIANEVVEVWEPVDTDQIIKSTEEVTNIFSPSTNQQVNYYVSTSDQENVDIFNNSESEYQNVDVAERFQNAASQIMEESETRDTTKEQEYAFVSSSSNTFEDSREQKEDVDIANSFQSFTNQIVEESKPVDTDQIVRSTEEATNMFWQPINEQQNYYVSNAVQASVDDVFKDSETEYQNVGISNSFQNPASQIMEELVIVDSTQNQGQAFVSNGFQASEIFENSETQTENVDIANSFQSIEVSKPEYIQRSQVANDQQINLLSSGDNLNNIFEQSNADTSAYTSITDTPDYDDYDTEMGTGELDFFSQLFGSESQEDPDIFKEMFGTTAVTGHTESDATKEAKSIIEQSRLSMELFNKVNRKNAVNVFGNSDLFNFSKQ